MYSDIAGVLIIEQCKCQNKSTKTKTPNDQRSTIFSEEFLTFDYTES